MTLEIEEQDFKEFMELLEDYRRYMGDESYSNHLAMFIDELMKKFNLCP